MGYLFTLGIMVWAGASIFGLYLLLKDHQKSMVRKFFYIDNE